MMKAFSMVRKIWNLFERIDVDEGVINHDVKKTARNSSNYQHYITAKRN
jgi:hypothetical protein